MVFMYVLYAFRTCSLNNDKTAFVIEGKLSLGQSQITQNPVNQSNLKVSDADDLKRGQMWPSVSRIVLGLLLIEW